MGLADGSRVYLKLCALSEIGNFDMNQMTIGLNVGDLVRMLHKATEQKGIPYDEAYVYFTFSGVEEDLFSRPETELVYYSQGDTTVMALAKLKTRPELDEIWDKSRIPVEVGRDWQARGRKSD